MASGVQLMLKLRNMSEEKSSGELGIRDEELGIRDEDELLSEGEKLGIRDEEVEIRDEELGIRTLSNSSCVMPSPVSATLIST